MKKIKPSKYSTSAVSDSATISTLKGILDNKRVFAHLSENDKTPNNDGYIELIDEEGYPLGKLEVQIKTLKKGYKLPSYNVNLSLLTYAKSVVQLPFVIIGVDQTNKKAFWMELDFQTASSLIDKALAKRSNQESIAIQFALNNSIPNNSPYERWGTLVNEQKKRLQTFDDLNKELLATKELVGKLMVKSNKVELERNPFYVKVHLFLDEINELLSKDLKIIRTAFISDFWRLGIILFQFSETSLTYSLFPIENNQNLKQINSYNESTDFQKFLSEHPSFNSFSGVNPIFSAPKRHAYERCWEYLKHVLHQKLLWPEDEYLQQEFLFHLKDTQFIDINSREEARSLDLEIFKNQINDFLSKVPEFTKQRMKVHPQMDGNLYRALDYVQNFRMKGINIINRKTPSKKALQSIAASIGERGVFNENATNILDAYWSAVTSSYNAVIQQYFPLLSKNLEYFRDFNTELLIPFIQVVPNTDNRFRVARVAFVKIIDPNLKHGSKIMADQNSQRLKINYISKTVDYRGKTYSILEIDRKGFPELIDNMPIRRAVYNLLGKNLGRYFSEKIEEKI
jgi:hypothetical protein